MMELVRIGLSMLDIQREDKLGNFHQRLSGHVEREMFEECFGEGPFVFRLNDNGVGPQLLTQVCLERGWREFNLENGDHWNLWWRTSGFPVSHHRNLYAWQFINHIPKGSSICRKDNLARYLKCMKKVYGSIYDFSPHGYNLPLEYTKLAAECSKSRPLSGKEDTSSPFREEYRPVWICKPVAQSQGRGIFLFRKLSELTYDSNTVVQRYIEKPLLIGGYKFDLRLYVCIPSYHPVTIYMYREGLARFGTDKFTLNDLRNPFRHLTNSSINKLGPGYTEMKDRVGSGCKWTLRQLRRYFQQASIKDWLLWQRISALVILTVLSHVAQVPPTVNCFEFFGFDVLIDESLRPWLLEVNLSPALGNDCDADISVKKPMLHDMFDLLGLPLYNTGLAVFDIWTEESKENREDNDDSLLKGKHPLSVIAAAGRWRRKNRTSKLSSACTTTRTISASRTRNPKLNPISNLVLPKLQTQSTHSPSHANLQQHQQSKQQYRVEAAAAQKLQDDEARKAWKRWGNGRDWNDALPREGGWVRLWPMTSDAADTTGGVNNNKKNTMKYMVAQINKFTKLAKDICRKYPLASEGQWTEYLHEAMHLSTDVWIPPK